MVNTEPCDEYGIGYVAQPWLLGCKWVTLRLNYVQRGGFHHRRSSMIYGNHISILSVSSIAMIATHLLFVWVPKGLQFFVRTGWTQGLLGRRVRGIRYVVLVYIV